MFGDPHRFGHMVRDDYPMVWRPSDGRFSRLEERGERMMQGVLVTDGDGTLHVLEYQNGAGRVRLAINGVRFRRAGDAGA